MARDLYGYVRWNDFFIPVSENYYGSGPLNYSTINAKSLPIYENFWSDFGIAEPTSYYTSISRTARDEILNSLNSNGFILEKINSDMTWQVPMPFLIRNSDGTVSLWGTFRYDYGSFRFIKYSVIINSENVYNFDINTDLVFSISTTSYTNSNFVWLISDSAERLTSFPGESFYRYDPSQLASFELSLPNYKDYLKIYDEIPPLAKPINFYASPATYETNSGEIVTPNFVIVYDDDTIEENYTNITYNESNYFKDTISELQEDGVSIKIITKTMKHLSYVARPNIEKIELFATVGIDILDAENPYFPDGDSTTGGGGGGYGSGESYFGTSGLIPNGTVESNDSVGSMYTRYAMNITDLNTVGNYFWSEDLGLQVAKTLISLFYGDPVQTIISCVSYPFNISNLLGTTQRELRWGGHATGLQMQSLNSNAFQIDWGSVQVNEYWGNFLDYSPFTKFQLYLPWGTGFVDIDPNDVMRAKVALGSNFGSGVIRVVTNVEVSRGMCVHHVIANDTVIGSYSGSCGRQIPITGSDYASKQVAIAGAAVGTMVAGAVSAGSSALEYGSRKIGGSSSLISGGATDSYNKTLKKEIASKGKETFSKAMRPAIASAAALAVSPPHVSRSGSFQEGTGSLTIQSPYLIISRPRMSMPANYGNLYGYPSNIYTNLGSLSGYTEVGSIHLDGIPATMEELSEIDDLLKGGVIL